jgi:hypothetical protein
MANISDSAGIFTGGTLDAFNQMQALVARDGDQVGAAEEMRRACLRVCSQKETLTSGSNGKTTTKRS